MMTLEKSRTNGAKKPDNLTDAEQLEVVRMIGNYYTTEDIGKYLDTIGKRPAQVGRTIWHYRHSEKFRPLIEKFKAEYESRLTDIAITSKRYRLQRLEQMHESLFNDGKYELAAKMLDRVRDEVEGKHADGRPNIFITQFNQLSDTEIEERKLKVLAAIERVRRRQTQQLQEATGYEVLRTEETKQTEAEIVDVKVTDEQSA